MNIFRKFKPLALLFHLLLISPVFAGEPPTEPILKIETGMHTAPIRRISIDAGERVIVTGSLDKTIKVWELKTGRLLKTLRPPIGSGNEGKIYAVSISPDGRHIAAAGWTGGEWDDSASIYIFERESGSIIKTIKGPPNVIHHLTYSKDGRYLVACLGGNNGIRVYEVEGTSSSKGSKSSEGSSGSKGSSYVLVFEDKDYEDSYWADFDSKGRLVTTSYDGYIRLYGKNFKLIAKKRTEGGKEPFSISFSPDDSKIAVGFDDTKNVDIYSGDDLTYLYSADTRDIDNEDLSTVTFSSDGRYLLAGGKAHKSINNEWWYFIRRWDKAGRGEFIDIPVAKNTIMGIIPLSSGGFVYASTEPSFGIADASGRIAYKKENNIADLRGNLERFLVSYDGSVVRFGYEAFGKTPAVFDVNNLTLNVQDGLMSSTGLRLLPPITESRMIKVTDWRTNLFTKLNGKPIELDKYEFSRSLAILPDESGFVLGTEWYVRLYDKEGKLKWRVPSPSTTWSVNVSGNGRTVIAGFGDGTIRWFRMTDGQELLSLFPHKDTKRWILWTPKGYYAASVGAEELIGWHINNGKDREADFFPASRFRDRFYRPDIIAKLFETYDEEKAIALANEESGRKRTEASIKDILPPVITILSPSDGERLTKNEITVRYSIRNPSGEPVTAIKVLIDGRPVSKQRGVVIVEKGSNGSRVQEFKLSVPERDFELSLIAENRYTSSVPSTVRLYWAGKKEEYIVKPKLYILAIGVSRYNDESMRLQFAHKDAEDFVITMKAQKGKLYEDVIVKLLTDEKATKDEILDGLEWLQRETTSKDIAMLFIAGHGVNDPAGIYYFLPQNADIDKLKRTGIAFSEIKNTVSSIAGKVVMFVDTCHAGGVMGKRAVTDITGIINELTSAENGVVVFASSTGRQYSLEDPAWENGAFTKALVEGIGGKADLLGKGKITVNMLDAYIAERVKELTKGRQTPVTTKPQTVPDFPVAVK
ncbi:MAG: caspase family protein [Thermodesulfovibrio sp.]|nr:caspase family protein [Thermodesulfovibrio sp.]